MRARHGKKEKLPGKLGKGMAALCFTMALVLLLTSMGATLAKYRKEDKSAGTAAAAPFYFTSDKLKEVPPYYQIGAAGEDGMVEISFTLSNFVDDLRCTEKEIRYELHTQSAAGEVAGAGGSGTISGGKNTVPVTLSLRQTDFGADGTVTVIAEAVSPYEKNLSATFGFSPRQSGLQWQVREEKGAVVLELSGGEGGTALVSWPGGLTPDPADPLLQGAGDGSVSFAAEAGKRYALVFLKEDPGVSYGKADFTVLTKAGE